MVVVLISHDIHPPQGHAYDRLQAGIQHLGAWWHHLESTWIVECDRTPDEIQTVLKQYIGPTDQLLIFDISQCSGSWLGISQTGSKWLDEHLPRVGGDGADSLL